MQLPKTATVAVSAAILSVAPLVISDLPPPLESLSAAHAEGKGGGDGNGAGHGNGDNGPGGANGNSHGDNHGHGGHHGGGGIGNGNGGSAGRSSATANEGGSSPVSGSDDSGDPVADLSDAAGQRDDASTAGLPAEQGGQDKSNFTAHNRSDDGRSSGSDDAIRHGRDARRWRPRGAIANAFRSVGKTFGLVGDVPPDTVVIRTPAPTPPAASVAAAPRQTRSARPSPPRPSPPRPSPPRLSLSGLTAVPVARPDTAQRDVRATLAGLDTLNRDYRVFMASTDPRLSALKSYVDAAIAHEDATIALAAAQASLDAAEQAFAAVTAGIRSHDGYSYKGRSVAEITERVVHLHTLERTDRSHAESAVIDAQIQALTTALNSRQARALADAQAAVEAAARTEATLQAATSDAVLTNALLAAVDENGVEGHIDAEMLAWAKTLLGVGAAYGRIDEVREARTSGIPAMDRRSDAVMTQVESLTNP